MSTTRLRVRMLWTRLSGGSASSMKIDIDLKSGFLQNLKREVLDSLNTEERAIIEVSTGEMGNKPDAVKLGWLKMRTKESWTKQRYTRALDRVMKKLRDELAAQAAKKG